MVVIGQILVIGVGVNRLDMSLLDTVFIIDHLQYRRDGIGSARGGGNDDIIDADLIVIDAIDNILEVTLARRREDDLCHSLRLQV